MEKFSLIILIFSCLVHNIEGCNCFWDQHEQSKYCYSEYAVKVLTLSEKFVQFKPNGTHEYFETENVPNYGNDVKVEYEVEVIKTYKGSVKEGARNKIYSAFNGAKCGTRLGTNHYYFLAGTFGSNETLSIGSCDLKIDTTGDDDLTSEIISENFETNWKTGCGKCKFCYKDPKTCGDKNTCAWNSEKQSLLSHCSPSDDVSGACRLWIFDTKVQKWTSDANSTKLNKICFFILFAFLLFLNPI